MNVGGKKEEAELEGEVRGEKRREGRKGEDDSH